MISQGWLAATGEGQGHPVLERTRSAMAAGGGVEGDEVEFVRGAGVKVELDGYARPGRGARRRRGLRRGTMSSWATSM